MIRKKTYRHRAGLFAITGLAIGGLLPQPLAPVGEAAAQGFFGGVAGRNCQAFQAAGGQFWQGFIRAREESPFIHEEGLYEVTHYRCFQSQAECDAWLYDMQSTYVTTSRTWCRAYVG